VIKAKRVVEWIKTALVVLLTASALILAWRTTLFTGLLSSIPFFGSVAELMKVGSGTTEMSRAELKEAARPLSIVITNENGERHGVKYDTDARNAVYDRTSSIIGEALGSALMPKEISEDEWREALSGPGVYFEYISPVWISVLDGWLGARIPGAVDDALLRRVYVAFGEDKSRIYYEDIERDLFFGADTASTAGKLQELEMYSANGAVFAFETGIEVFESEPYTLILPGNDHPDVSAAAAGSAEELLQIALAALGHIEEDYTTYTDPRTGILVCVGTRFNIRVDTNGRVHYRRTDGPPLNDEENTYSMSEMIERARVIVSDTIAETCGNAEVFFESFEYGAGNTCSVSFGYYIAGGRMFLHDDSHAAQIKFSSGMVTEIELFFRNFTFTGEYSKLLPEIQALAAAKGGLLLSYSDTGAETLQPSWVRQEPHPERTWGL